MYKLPEGSLSMKLRDPYQIESHIRSIPPKAGAASQPVAHSEEAAKPGFEAAATFRALDSGSFAPPPTLLEFPNDTPGESYTKPAKVSVSQSHPYKRVLCPDPSINPRSELKALAAGRFRTSGSPVTEAVQGASG